MTSDPRTAFSPRAASSRNVLRAAITAAALIAVAGQAQAISRYESQRLTCDQAQARIASEGAVILRYRSARNPSLPLYDRYVKHGGFCAVNEVAANAYVPTADTDSCYVRVCKQPTFDDRGR